jgi:hypothetical protein
VIIDLQSIDREQFDVAEHFVAGETCFLVTPKRISVNWTTETLIYRSSLWTAAGEPVSLSWRKHINWDERPDLDPAPKDLTGCELMEKIDGSTLLISRFKDTLIVRTRGTIDATRMDNGHEIELFRAKYPKLFNLSAYGDFTVVCEWVSPANQIVIPYSEPDLYLTGMVYHDGYTYSSQDFLDSMAETVGVKRPRRYSFDTIPEMLAAVTAFKGVEGVCVYYNGGQSWRKHKAAAYLILHRFKERATLPNILDLWFGQACPDLTTFQANLTRDFDHECATSVLLISTRILEVNARVDRELDIIHRQVWPLKLLPRRDAALQIQAMINKPYQGAAFTLLSGKEVDFKQRRKLMEMVLDETVETAIVAS